VLHCLAAKTRRIVIANDIQHSDDPRFNRVRALGVQACLCIPLLVEDRVLGVLSFASRSKPAFAPDEIEFLQLISGHIAIAMDRARGEELLREREQRLKIALEAAKMGTWEVDVSGSKTAPSLSDEVLIKMFDSGHPSPDMEQMMGFKPGEYPTSAGWRRCIYPEDSQRTLEAFRSALKDNRPYDIEHRFVWPDGSVHWVHCRGLMFHDKEGAPQRFMGVSVDITDQRRSEEAILQSKEAAEKANHAKDLFIAALSHELRTPLTPALMTATALEQDDAVDSSVRKQMRIVRRSVELEARLIDDLLDLTRIERGKFSLRLENVDIRELFARAMEIEREDILLRQLDVQLNIEAGKTVLHGDPARLQQVFWNLLKNAIKFTPVGGSIRIRIFNPNPQTLTFEIRDNGMGIPPESLEKIFNPFEQRTVANDHRYGGLGLGLSISKSIVELHGGTIFAASAGLDQGATFTINLPTAAILEDAMKPPAAVRRKAGDPLHILLVEDHEQTRNILARVLSRDGHAVQAEGTFTAALQAAHSSSITTPFDVLISDIGLPDGSGLKLVEQLKAEFPALTAIALSGYGTQEDMEKSLQAGFGTHLTKPIAIEDLRRALSA